MVASRISYELKKGSEHDCVILRGPINEYFLEQVTALVSSVGKVVTLDLGGVESINSAGVRCFLEFVRNFADERVIVIERCSPVFINQVNLIPDIAANAQIISFFADYYCDDCDREAWQLFEVAQGLEAITGAIGKQNCGGCEKPLELQGDADLYLRFLKRMKRPA